MIGHERSPGDFRAARAVCPPATMGSIIPPGSRVGHRQERVGEEGVAAAASRGLALSLLLLAALAGCAADQPVLTLVFEHVPLDTQQIEVTLHGRDATFMGPDAGNDQVGVRYASGNVVIAIDATYAAARGNHIRLPLTAGKPGRAGRHRDRERDRWRGAEDRRNVDVCHGAGERDDDIRLRFDRRRHRCVGRRRRCGRYRRTRLTPMLTWTRTKTSRWSGDA